MKAISKAMLLHLSPEVVRKLGKLSEAHGVSIAELVSRAVERQLPEWEAGNFLPAPVTVVANRPLRREPPPPTQP